MSGISINVSQRKLHKALRKTPEALKKNIFNAMGRIVSSMSNHAKINVPDLTANLKNSIKTKRPDAFTGQVSTGMDYAYYVHEGRKPGAKMPPIDSILDWIKVAKIQPNNDDVDQEGLAWLIARSIKNKGIPARPFLQNALDAKRAFAVTKINQAIDKSLGLI